jgi:hypothetical protein
MNYVELIQLQAMQVFGNSKTQDDWFYLNMNDSEALLRHVEDFRPRTRGMRGESFVTRNQLCPCAANEAFLDAISLRSSPIRFAMDRLDVRSAVDTAVTNNSTLPVSASYTLIIREPSGLTVQVQEKG